MKQQSEFWKLGHLTHSQLLESLNGVLRTKRRALAELIAHLAEVEERRLHLEAAHGSMFDYCVASLGMSEDEACRRIDLARLARGYPALYPLLASGEITLSMALVLKPILSPANHEQLFAAARGKSIRAARELVAQSAPRPDAPSSIRKLPERRAAEEIAPRWDPPLTVTESPRAPAQLAARDAPVETSPAASAAASARLVPPPHHQRCIEPLSPQRYKIQFTADKAVKDQLEQARDLLRHAIPSGDFGPIIARALDLLITDLLRRRFGASARRTAVSALARPDSRGPHAPVKPPDDPALSGATADPTGSQVPRAVRRAVVERDGLACTWRNADGKRCGSRAWLEIDHRHPRAKGGGAEPENLRILCRAHNHLAAEREYGRAHVQRATRARQQARAARAKNLSATTMPTISQSRG
jgi:hypothetical protein